MSAPRLTVRGIRAVGVEAPMKLPLGTSAGTIRSAPLLLIDVETEDHAPRKQAEELRRHTERISGGKQRLRADTGLEDRGFGRMRFELADEPRDRGAVDVRHLRERGREHRPSSVFSDEVGELPAKPALEYRNRLELHGNLREPGDAPAAAVEGTAIRIVRVSSSVSAR